MPTAKLTKRFIEAQRPMVTTIFWDTEVHGFGVRISPSLRRTYLLQYREGGAGAPTRRPSIGCHGSPWTVDQARARAREWLAQIAAGQFQGPAGRPAAAAPRTFFAARREFIDRYAKPRNRTWQEADRTLGRYFFDLEDRDVRTIAKGDIYACVDTIMKRGRVSQANRALAHARKLFAWLEDQEYVDKNPLHKSKMPAKEKSRDRVLSDFEVAQVLHAAKRIGYPFGDIVQLLALTGQRRDEVASMRWQEIELRKGLWVVPQDRNKSGRSNIVTLSRCAARLIIRAPKREECELVFTTNGNTAFSGFSKGKSRLDALSGVKDWRLHDLRRTIAVGMQRLGVLPAVIEIVLNHENPIGSEIAGIYQRYRYETEVRAALLQWSRHLSGLARNS